MEKSAKELMEQGWQAREAHDFDKAEKLLEQAYSIFIEQNDYFNATECLNHLGETQKIKAIVILEKAKKYVEDSFDLAKEKGSKIDLVLRAFMSVYATSGDYEAGLPYLQDLLSRTGNPANRADYLSHLATYQMRMGDVTSAKISIDEAEGLIEEGWDSEREPHRSIWKTRILMTKSLVLYNMGDFENARNYAEKAVDIAREKDLKTRITQAENLLKIFL